MAEMRVSAEQERGHVRKQGDNSMPLSVNEARAVSEYDGPLLPLARAPAQGPMRLSWSEFHSSKFIDIRARKSEARLDNNEVVN